MPMPGSVVDELIGDHLGLGLGFGLGLGIGFFLTGCAAIDNLLNLR